LTRPKAPLPPSDSLDSATRNLLQSYELSRLNYTANGGREIKQLLDTYIEESSNARFARLLIEQRENQRCGENETPLKAAPGIPEADAEPVATASDNFLPENGLPRGQNRTVS
jgi:hypothetical protein